MDKQLACHSIALEAAKHNTESNMMDDTNFNFDEYVSDMTQKYIDAYNVAENIFSKPENASRVKIGSTSVKFSN